MKSKNVLLNRLNMTTPIIQAPMVGVSTPKLAAEVSNAGGLGSIGLGAATVSAGRKLIRETKALTQHSFNVNFFCHAPAQADITKETNWLQTLTPLFRQFGAVPPEKVSEIYTSFTADDDMFQMLLEECPPIVSFHFGLPGSDKINALKAKGIYLLATATNLVEAEAIEAAGIDAIVAQGWEAGGHRGCFDPRAHDDQLTTKALTALLVKNCSIPIIAAGGIMNGNDISAALEQGASAAQLGTAFIACEESCADTHFREALQTDIAKKTIMTQVISGRPARAISNKFAIWGQGISKEITPDYPTAYDAGKALNAAAIQNNEYGYAAQWAGTGAPHIRPMPARQLLETLKSEILSP